MKKGSKTDLKIDAKIIKRGHWALQGRPEIDFDYFLGGFERLSKTLNFWIRQISTKNQKVCKNLKIRARGGRVDLALHGDGKREEFFALFVFLFECCM